MNRILLLSYLCLSFPVFSALPPLVQSTREIQALLSDPSLQSNLGSGELIQEILRTDTGYLVLTNKHAMQVDIQYIPSGIGPVKFQLEFREPVELNSNP